ncbi:MAG: PepSY domain-containing protein [Parvibaculaceae bacterium]|nr:PepSY domain-containing protein [Parvibaculaceae bacterium]
MTNFKKLLLAGTASLGLIAGPALAADMDQPAGADAQMEGAVELSPAADAETSLQALGYTDIEPVEAEGDASEDGVQRFNATNIDGDRVTVEFDSNSATVIGEEPAY